MTVSEFINAQTRSISMYKGMALGLSGVWFVALCLSFVGLLDFTPISMIVSMLVLVLSTYLTSLVCGKLFGLKAHLESSLITGLILALIFTPVADVTQLVVLLFIGMIAGASKFIITLGGRHIFNPAALAAVVIGLTGLGAASWWVATPVLTPIILVVVAISLYQSKRFLVAGVFLAITVPAVIIQSLYFGATFPESLWLLLSWPLLFMAGIMLTEPLTLPPRKWQMYVVAAVTAVLFLLPFKLGVFQFTPAVALIGGNIVAVFFARRHAVQLTFKRRRSLTPTTDELIFSTTAPVSFIPGQYMEIALPHKKADFRGVRRSFSITSLPEQKEVSFGIKFYEPSSTLKKTLRTLKLGDTFNAINVAGDFVLPRDTQHPLLFVAGGIGITPFIAHLKSLEGTQRDIILVYAVNSLAEIAYKELLETSGMSVIVVSPQKLRQLPKHWRASQGSRINYDTLPELVPDLTDRWAFVSGPVPFVQGAKRSLRKLGVRNVKSDYFTGY
jgi:ferredoxin-NADP reductase